MPFQKSQRSRSFNLWLFIDLSFTIIFSQRCLQEAVMAFKNSPRSILRARSQLRKIRCVHVFLLISSLFHFTFAFLCFAFLSIWTRQQPMEWYHWHHYWRDITKSITSSFIFWCCVSFISSSWDLRKWFSEIFGNDIYKVTSTSKGVFDKCKSRVTASCESEQKVKKYSLYGT